MCMFLPSLVPRHRPRVSGNETSFCHGLISTSSKVSLAILVTEHTHQLQFRGLLVLYMCILYSVALKVMSYDIIAIYIVHV